MEKVSAIDIKQLFYCDEISAPLTPASLKALLKTAKEIDNVHQDTWQIEEGEASQDSYRNQLTGNVYRMSKRQMGDLTVAFTIGQYDYMTKAAIMGGKALKADGSEATTADDAIGWERAIGVVELYKTLIALTYDDVYVVIPRAQLGSREASTDGAIGLAVSGTMMEPLAKTSGVSSEYWYSKKTVDAANEG